MRFDDNAFIAKLRHAVPADVTIAYGGGVLSVAVGNDAASVIDVSASLRIGEWSSAVWTLLSAVQDEIGVSGRRPWPVHHHGIALPHVTVGNGVLRAWYGTDTEVVVDVGEFSV